MNFMLDRENDCSYFGFQRNVLRDILVMSHPLLSALMRGMLYQVVGTIRLNFGSCRQANACAPSRGIQKLLRPLLSQQMGGMPYRGVTIKC